jgi:hypothetical protein
MCTSPLHLIRPNLGFNFDVPCNDCLECRTASQDSWVFRLGVDLKALYERKGFGVFLTFTYTDHSLPHSDFGLKGQKVVPCFSADDVSRFLNKVKVYMYRTYGKGSYKYFMCSEYGKFTKRPHYHALFMLEHNVDYYQFVETCRKYWLHGFMFPRHNGYQYVDNFGNATTPLLHNAQNACKYVCKYITKDLDYYEIPTIKKYLEVRYALPKEVRASFNKRLPKHFQSKGIGSSFFSSCDNPNNLLACVSNGVINPTNCRVMQLPRYYVEHFAFAHRPAIVDGNKVIVRTLKDEYADAVRTVHLQSFRSKALALNNFFVNVSLPILQKYDYTLSDLKFVQSLANTTPEELVARYFINNLSPSARWYFKHLGYSYDLESVSDFRLQMYKLDFGNLPCDFEIDEAVSKLFDIYHNVVLPQRSEVLNKRYNEYLIAHKLRLISKGCI